MMCVSEDRGGALSACDLWAAGSGAASHDCSEWPGDSPHGFGRVLGGLQLVAREVSEARGHLVPCDKEIWVDLVCLIYFQNSILSLLMACDGPCYCLSL